MCARASMSVCHFLICFVCIQWSNLLFFAVQVPSWYERTHAISTFDMFVMDCAIWHITHILLFCIMFLHYIRSWCAYNRLFLSVISQKSVRTSIVFQIGIWNSKQSTNEPGDSVSTPTISLSHTEHTHTQSLIHVHPTNLERDITFSCL